RLRAFDARHHRGRCVAIAARHNRRRQRDYECEDVANRSHRAFPPFSLAFPFQPFSVAFLPSCPSALLPCRVTVFLPVPNVRSMRASASGGPMKSQFLSSASMRRRFSSSENFFRVLNVNSFSSSAFVSGHGVVVLKRIPSDKSVITPSHASLL